MARPFSISCLLLHRGVVAGSSTTGFHVVGCSLGGALAVAFTLYFPNLVRLLALVAPGGLIRAEHVGLVSRLLYFGRLLPDSLVAYLVRRRIEVREKVSPINEDAVMDVSKQGRLRPRNDATGGSTFDHVPISRDRPHVRVASVIAWQLERHGWFVQAFVSTIRHAPLYSSMHQPQPDFVSCLHPPRATKKDRHRCPWQSSRYSCGHPWQPRPDH